ncbi:WhiB family transcriptional regulator [Streptomyces sp. NPDC001584]|uniref:WhiB family transcriptional regulator n=1 Tax=Streptomyces sp. NPDC001584 TaxID=3154521 RepID=UPI003332BCA1
MLNEDQNSALSALEAHPTWPLRSCAVTDELGTLLVDPELFYTPGAENEEDAKQVCAGCPVLVACRSYALGGTGWWESDGIWGGMTVEERRAERRARTKRRSRLARQGEKQPAPVENWKPSPAQETLLQALAEHPDLRAAAVTMATPFPNVRWVYSQLCEQLGVHQDDLPITEVVEQATARFTIAPAANKQLEVAA